MKAEGVAGEAEAKVGVVVVETAAVAVGLAMVTVAVLAVAGKARIGQESPLQMRRIARMVHSVVHQSGRKQAQTVVRVSPQSHDPAFGRAPRCFQYMQHPAARICVYVLLC